VNQAQLDAFDEIDRWAKPPKVVEHIVRDDKPALVKPKQPRPLDAPAPPFKTVKRAQAKRTRVVQPAYRSDLESNVGDARMPKNRGVDVRPTE
jgi:hypothetical protein